MLQRIRSLAADGLSFAFETTLATRSFKPLMRDFQRQGYELHLIFLWLPSAAMAIERVHSRVKAGGHSVPDNVIERRYERGLENFFNLYRPIADSWIMLDNSGGSDPKPIAWRNIGGPVQIVGSGPWNFLRERYEKDILT